MSFITSQAEGMATNGKIDILEVITKTIYERAQNIIGSPKDVKEYLAFVKSKPAPKVL